MGLALKATASAKAPTLKGILLVGPPGTENSHGPRLRQTPFGHLCLGQFGRMYAGVGRAADPAPLQAGKWPCRKRAVVVFVDECPRAKRGVTGAYGIRQTLNEFLVSWTESIVNGKSRPAVAATNRADILDPALLRPGRLTGLSGWTSDKAGRLRVARSTPWALRWLEVIWRRRPGNLWFFGASGDSSKRPSMLRRSAK